MALGRAASAFWIWYERHYNIHITLATLLFLAQLVHLVWLTLDVVWMRLFDVSYFPIGGFWLTLVVIVDLFEIPALITVSLVYINELRNKITFKPILYLVLLNSQWIHIFWITDEFIVSEFTAITPTWPAWVAWMAILLDYLELPVMLDTTKRAVRALAGKGSLAEAFAPDESKRAG
jgi:hypothetical protein